MARPLGVGLVCLFVCCCHVHITDPVGHDGDFPSDKPVWFSLLMGPEVGHYKEAIFFEWETLLRTSTDIVISF